MSPLFHLVYSALQYLSSVTGLSYELINVLIWYVFLPALFLFLIDQILKKVLLLPLYAAAIVILLFSVGDIEQFADRVFDWSVDFLLVFSKLGIDYDRASLIICILIPLLLFLALAFFAYPAWFERHAPTLTSLMRKENSK